MTSRQMGRRISAQSRRRNGRSSVRRKQRETLSAGDLRRLAQLVACGSIFVLLVAAKLLLPAKMAVFNEKLSAAMERNMDVQAVFSAVGRVVSGETDGGVEAFYQAVFQPQAEDAGGASQAGFTLREDAASGFDTADMTARKVNGQAGAAMEMLRSSRKEEGEAAPPPEAEDLAYVLYSQENLPEGVSMEQAILGFDYCAPVSGTVSSDFGYREHPVEGEERFHYGVDLAAEAGTEVACFADGTVTAVGDSSSYGRYCVVAHEGGYSTLYAHCSRITASSGATVNRGQKIAEVGETGMATGPHLHFELQREGTYLNPIYYVSTL